MTIAGSKLNGGAPPVKTMGPPRLPPPKMKDLFAASAPAPAAGGTPHGAPLANPHLDRSASIVRQVPPDDPYVDAAPAPPRSRTGYYSQSSHHSTASLGSSVENHGADASAGTGERRYNAYSHAPPPLSRPESRQISGTSAASSALSSHGAASTVASGSENWETYDEDDEDETADARGGGGGARADMDSTEAYYARLRAQHHAVLAVGKRASPDGGWVEGVGKRARNGGTPARGVAGRVAVVEGNEAGWMDDDRY